MLDDAYEEHAERRQSEAERDRRRAVEAEQTRLLREELARQHPELAAYSQQSTSPRTAAPF
ncbi:hypothetical protein [Streptomyces amritsarensis]|uniref:hypothetical protein n=1 Tax=Streptomyces amritsarensis TaxID=681158 RepID=UPI0036A28030